MKDLLASGKQNIIHDVLHQWVVDCTDHEGKSVLEFSDQRKRKFHKEKIKEQKSTFASIIANQRRVRLATFYPNLSEGVFSDCVDSALYHTFYSAISPL